MRELPLSRSTPSWCSANSSSNAPARIVRPSDPTTEPPAASRAAAVTLSGPIFVAAVALALLLPVVDLDPFRGVTASNSPFSDEVWNVLNARNLVLLGTWSTDEWNLHLLNGPFALVEAAVFAALGVGIVQARLVAIACTALTGAVIVLGLQRWVGRSAAAIAALGYVTSALALFYGRMAYVEPMTGLFLVTGLLTLTAIDGRPTRWGAVAGFAFGLALASKALAIPFVGAALLATAWLSRSDPQLRRWLTGAAFALVSAGLAWALIVWLPHRDEIGLMVTRVLPQLQIDLGLPTIRRALGYLAGSGDDRAVLLSLPLLLAAAVGVLLAVRDRASLARRAAVPYAVAALGLAVSLVVVAAASYHPNRYVVPFLPVGAILIGPAVQALRSRIAAWRRPRGLGLLIESALVAALCLPGFALHLGWIASSTRELPALQAAAIETIPPGQVVAGPYSALVAFRAPVVALVTCCQAQPANAGDLYATHGARFVVSGAIPPEWILNHPGGWEARARLLCFRWDVVSQEFCLYRLP
jgi:4-amino-4-deoxy-L-arabinose transferase-like glycosyltransferase